MPATETRSGAATAEDLVVEFFARWGVSFEAMRASFEERMAPDCYWEQRPMAVTTTRAEALRFLDRARRWLRLATVEVELRHVAAVGDVVITDRVDHLRRADGRLIASAPVAGVLELRDGQIVRWREHFDTLSFVAQAVRNLVSKRH